MAEHQVIDTRALRKHYGRVEALRGLELSVPAGSICGFVGRNGAGKTTTIKVLLGMVHASGGDARVFGLDVAGRDAGVQIRQRTGYVSDEKDLYDSMTVAEIIRFTRSFYPRWRDDLEQRYRRDFGLRAGDQVKALSRGTRTRLAMLLALARGAELLILDEPTSGLDPAAAEAVLQAIVGQVADEGVTVLFSTHQIVEVEQIADRVAMIDAGRVTVAGGVDDLRQRFRRVRMVFESDAPAAAFATASDGRLRAQGRVLTLLAERGIDAMVDKARALGAVSVDVVPVSLKDIFLEAALTEN